MQKTLISTLFFIFLSIQVFAQFIAVGQDTLYGNEWINYNQTYFKIKVVQDGIYRVTSQTLENAGVPLSQVNGEQFQLWHNGQQTPIYTTTNSTFSASDFIEFFGEKNTSELDRFLFRNPDSMMMNPLYSLITDTSAYFLTWVSNGGNLRFQNTANDLTNLPAKEDYYMAKFISNSVNNVRKKADSQGISTSDYSMAEGYATDFANVKTYILNPTAIYFGNVGANLEFRFSGNNGQHQQVIQLNDQPIFTAQYYDYEVQKPVIDLTNAQLTTTMNVKVQGLQSNSDNHRMANIILTYPRSYDFENKQSFAFDIAASNTVKYLEISNFNSNNGQPVLYDLTNHLRIVGANEGGLIKIALPPSQVGRKLILVNDNSGQVSVTTLKQMSFIDYQSMSNDYIIITGKKLLDDGAGNNRVQEYADYRASLDGGSFNPIIVEVEQLYEQFSWGIERHPFAVRNFALYIKKNWANPKYFFIIGKGREYPSYRSAAGLQSALNFGFYVPTYSFPGSDNLLLAGTDGFTPVIPIGRIAAKSANEIWIYLNKVKEFEQNKSLPQTIADKAWMKNNLHLGGGNGAILSEQLQIRSNLENMAKIAMNGKMGSFTKGYYKTSTDPIQQPRTEEIFEYINNGLSLITFFGHSSVGVFDFSIDFPENWKNKGRYPWMISLGCYAGNIHTGSTGIGERFLFLPDAGSIAFTATAGQGYISALNAFTVKMYEELGGDSYGHGLGDLLKKTINHFQGSDYGVNLIRQQFNLLGDPSIRINPAPGPDYTIDAGSVKFTPEQVNAAQDYFKMEFDVVNIGENRPDSFNITIEQQLPDASKLIVIDTLMQAPGNRDKYIYEIEVPGKTSIGLNRFFVKVDATNKIDELPQPQAENNNELVMSNGEVGATLFIRDNSAIPAYPQEFGIVGTNDITLKAFTTDPLAPSRKYLLQIDTTELFTSNFMLNTEITQPGGVIRWKPTMTWQDETVYYWRISPDSLSPNEGFNWNASSFLYKNGSPEGWNQSHFYQFKKDEFVNLELNGHGEWEYLQNFKDFSINNKPGNILVTIANAVRGQFWGGSSTAYIFWMDSVLIEPKINMPPYPFGLPHPWGINSATHFFDVTTPIGRKQVMDFIKDVVGPNDYVLFSTVMANSNTNLKTNEWGADSLIYGENLFGVLEQRGGSNMVRQLEINGSVPYAIGFKNNGVLFGESIATDPTGEAELFFSIDGNWDRGIVNSTYIGPAVSWETLNWKASSVSNPASDTVCVNVYGAKSPGKEQVLLMENIFEMNVDLNAINAVEYPYLRMRFNSEDSLFRTSADLDYWRVTYHGVPEFAFNPAANFDLINDTIQTGEPLKLVYQVENLSNNDGDSLLVKYAVINENNEQSLIYQRLPVIGASGLATAELTIDTRNNKGRQNLLVELNPADDQPEITHVNNFLQTNYFALGDTRNPLLEVTFDGTQIMDGELVSPSPQIQIVLTDENQFLLLDDTSRFKLFILYPDSIQPTPIALSNQDVRFTPAPGGIKNRATIEFSPVFTADGKYTLIVQARDVSGNASGLYDFKRSFEVVTSSSISNFVNYPNPFSTSTRFVYTMTGAAPPARYKLQIMTVSGRIVREVSQQELGELKTGTHLTDFAWDGKDEFGDQLANGVYLYRLIVEDEKGENWEKFEIGADKYFMAGYGKMVLVR